MKLEYSGNIYKFPLDFEMGFCFAEILDFSEISDFDGILIKVFGKVVKEKNDDTIGIPEIKKTGIMIGPLPINKYPNAKSKSGWVLYGKNKDFDRNPPFFKNLRGLLNDNNWANLKPWFKQNRFNEKIEDIQCDYEEVRNLETMILNHVDSIKIKTTMMKIIENNEDVSKYYDLKKLGNKNLFLQIVNTYYKKKIAEQLLATLS